MARVAIVTGGTRGIGEAISIALRDQGVTVAANYAGNDEKARAFTERTGIKAYKWDVADLDACLAGVAAGREPSWARSRSLVNNAGITRDGTMKRMDRASLGRGDRHQSRRLLQHGQGGLGRHERAQISAASSISARSTARPANMARSIMPPPNRAFTASPRRWPRKAPAPASPSTRSRPAISTPTWSPPCRPTCSRRSSPRSRSAASARPRRSRAASPSCARRMAASSPGSTLSINGGQHMY